MSQFALKSSEIIHSSQPPAALSPRKGKDGEACPMCRRGAATFHFPRTVFATLGLSFAYPQLRIIQTVHGISDLTHR